MRFACPKCRTILEFPDSAAGQAANCPNCGLGTQLPLVVVAPQGIGDDVGMRMLLPVGRSAWAIIAGYLGLLSLAFLPAPLAVVVSIIAMVDLRKHPEKHGWGRAIFGLVMGILGTISLIAMVSAVIGSRHSF